MSDEREDDGGIGEISDAASALDFLQAVKDVSGADYAGFYRRYIDGVEELPYGPILGKVGLTLADSAGRYRLALDSTATGAELGRAWLDGR